MPKIFTRTYRARYSDINADGLLAPADYGRYIIDTAYEWSESLGFGYEVSSQLGIYWVIRETEIQLFEPLHFREEFDFTIWMLEWKRVRGRRAFFVKNKQTGAAVAQGVQQIACMDSQTQRPVSPPEHFIDKFRLDDPQQVPSQRFPKIPVLPERSHTLQLKVAWGDLDVLNMVNNAVYIAYAEEALAQSFATFGWSPGELKAHGLRRQVRRVHIQYHLPATWEDTLDVSLFSLALDHTGGSVCVAMRRASDGESIASCILDWELIDRASGERRPLPEALVNALEKLQL